MEKPLLLLDFPVGNSEGMGQSHSDQGVCVSHKLDDYPIVSVHVNQATAHTVRRSWTVHAVNTDSKRH